MGVCVYVPISTPMIIPLIYPNDSSICLRIGEICLLGPTVVELPFRSPEKFISNLDSSVQPYTSINCIFAGTYVFLCSMFKCLVNQKSNSRVARPYVQEEQNA